MKPSAHQLAQRVRDIMDDMALGLSTPEIKAKRAAEWSVSARTIDRYAKAARERLADLVSKDDGHWLARHVAFRLRVAREAMEAGEFTPALAAMKDLGRLQQLYAADKAHKRIAESASEQLIALLSGIHGLGSVETLPAGVNAAGHG